MISEPTYLPARMVATAIEEHFQQHCRAAIANGEFLVAEPPPAAVIEAVIDIGFWASLRKEEGKSPNISLALLQPGQSQKPLVFGQKLRLTPHNLVKLAPAVDQPGVHVGVWPEGDALYIWGTALNIPSMCFVLEVVEAGLLVVKHRRSSGFGKFVNIAVLQGDQIKILEEVNKDIADCPALFASLNNMPMSGYVGESFNVLVQLAASMRVHGRGGLVLIVPPQSTTWKRSVVQPMKYPVDGSYDTIYELLGTAPQQGRKLEWQEELLNAIELIGGFTAVDGATVITSDYRFLAFGAKVARSENSVTVGEIIVTEPVAGATIQRVLASQAGGTRHLAGAQFVHDQHDAVALVASQDGQFTIFAWSEELQQVHAHRIETLLL